MNDPIVKPATATVTHFGATVPVSDHMLVGEIDELQTILTDTTTTALRKDLQCFAVLVRYRLGFALDLDEVMKLPLDRVAFTKDLRRLLSPFTLAQRDMFYESKAAQAQMLTKERLTEEVQMLEVLLEHMRKLRDEAEPES